MASDIFDQEFRYTRNENTISGRLQDEIVMMDIERGKYFSLNPVATRIWDLLENPLTLNDLVGLLMEEYDVEASQCYLETGNLISEMLELGLVSKQES